VCLSDLNGAPTAQSATLYQNTLVIASATKLAQLRVNGLRPCVIVSANLTCKPDIDGATPLQIPPNFTLQ
jgi:hypothetical protein